jgi:hypothetical protein
LGHRERCAAQRDTGVLFRRSSADYVDRDRIQWIVDDDGGRAAVQQVDLLVNSNQDSPADAQVSPA